MFIRHGDLLCEREENGIPALGRQGRIEVLDHDGGFLTPWRADEARSTWQVSPWGGVIRPLHVWVRGLVSHPTYLPVDLGSTWYRVERLPDREA